MNGNRAFAVQRFLLKKIDLYDNKTFERDYPIDFERIHMSSSATLGKILAKKRGVNSEMASIACCLHDYGRIVSGVQDNHAEAGYEPVKSFLEETALFTEDEIETIALAAKNHSSKNVVGTPIEEIVKDADVFDCWQYQIPMNRPEQKIRLEKVIKELI
ncbi:MAG TPA: metal-dependent phosphohydrolase [Eubacteriaceae bacterium]|nr:metal-dependent phosphohydrolase [Eubacteriaceae bacterium]